MLVITVLEEMFFIDFYYIVLLNLNENSSDLKATTLNNSYIVCNSCIRFLTKNYLIQLMDVVTLVLFR